MTRIAAAVARMKPHGPDRGWWRRSRPMEQIAAGGVDSGRTWGRDKGTDSGESHLIQHDYSAYPPADHSRAISIANEFFGRDLPLREASHRWCTVTRLSTTPPSRAASRGSSRLVIR
jgi:hypothetical protein